MITYEIDLDTPCILAEHWNSEGRPTRNHEKYRIAWEKAHGPIPDGLEILHLCCARTQHALAAGPACTGVVAMSFISH